MMRLLTLMLSLSPCMLLQGSGRTIPCPAGDD
jgi:hypothetical protein